MDLIINEEPVSVEDGATLARVKSDYYPRSDIIILNGCPVAENHAIGPGDRLVFITRGAVPTRGELDRLIGARNGPDLAGYLRNAVVAVAGLGGLGSAAALALARSGVGSLILADHDVVEPSNLNRQHYFADQIGRSKAAVLAETIRRANPFCDIKEHEVFLDEENIPRLFRSARVVLECLDRAEAKAMLIDTVMTRMPEALVVSASGVAGWGSSNSIRTRKAAERLWVVGDLCSEARPGVGLTAGRVGIAAHHQANAAVSLLMGEDPAR